MRAPRHGICNLERTTESKEQTMRLQIAVLAAALALAAGCNKGPDNSSQGGTRAAAPESQAQVNTSTTPANAGQPSQKEKKDGAHPPVQGQVDAKQGEQHKDFQHSGDGAGPKGSDTTPKRGG
jgi:hypothetical protein